VAEGTALLKLHRGNSIEGSNPSLSAIFANQSPMKLNSCPTRAMGCGLVLLAGGWGGATGRAAEDAWYRHDANARPRWSTAENPNGVPGQGARENFGAKGRAFVPLKAGATHRLLDMTGSGRITRIWLTVPDRSPTMLRSLKIEMFWDGSDHPAVAVPLGDFFGVGLGRTASFASAPFANAEGRALICTIPMPYRSGARVQVTNESGKDLTHLFYEVDFLETPAPAPDTLYFHAYWSRDVATAPGRDFELLPRVTGKGRYLGTNVGVVADARYGDTWWGEGEVKVYLDGDRDHPTLAGTGTEDYIGTGWGQGAFHNAFAGSTIADEKNRQWAFYRYHIPDPVYFNTECRVTLQQIGGAVRDVFARLQAGAVPLIPVTLDVSGSLRHLYEPGTILGIAGADLPDGWVNFYRSDDVSATAYFYLDRPTNGLPVLAPVAARVAGLEGR
jgi:hypothetical protein